MPYVSQFPRLQVSVAVLLHMGSTIQMHQNTRQLAAVALSQRYAKGKADPKLSQSGCIG